MKSSAPIKVTVLLLGLAAFAAGLYYFGKKDVAVPPTVLGIAPEDALAVGRIDVQRVLAAEAFRALLGERQDRKLARLRERCGMDPLSRVQSVDLFLANDETPSRDHLGLLFRGQLQDNALLQCVKHAIEEDGGGIRETHVLGLRGIASMRGDSRAVFLSDGAVLGGMTNIVENAIKVARRQSPSAIAAPVLAGTWAALDEHADVKLALRIPERWRPAFARMAQRAGTQAAANVAAVGAAITLGAPNRLQIVVRAQSAEDASELATTLQRLLAAQREDVMIALTALGPILGRIHIEARGTEVRASVTASTSEVQALAELYERIDRGEPMQQPAPTPQAETIRPATTAADAGQ